MTKTPATKAKKDPAAPVVKRKKELKARPEIPTPDERYELARKAEIDRIARHGVQERLRNGS